MAIGFSVTKATVDSTVAGMDVSLREWCDRVDRLSAWLTHEDQDDAALMALGVHLHRGHHAARSGRPMGSPDSRHPGASSPNRTRRLQVPFAKVRRTVLTH